ncbi:MAG: GlxA family transcriptional regulator [Pseudomonadota bacterium]
MPTPPQEKTDTPQHRVAVILVPEFSLMAFSCSTEPLRSANRMSGKSLYDWRVFTLDGKPCRSSSGIEIASDGEPELAWPDTILICGGLDLNRAMCEPYHRLMHRFANRGIRIGGVSTGGYLLASAGLLDGYRCTLHWEYIGSFAEDFPNLDITDQLYVIDRNRMTSSGGTAAMDMMLALIASEHGEDLATLVASQFIHERARIGSEHQRIAEDTLNARQSQKMADAITLMRENMESPLTPRELAQHVNLSLRQLERLFRKYKNDTPQHYYLLQRLEQAHRYIIQTGMPLIEVAVAVGFVSQSQFTKCYRDHYGRTPLQNRRMHDQQLPN